MKIVYRDFPSCYDEVIRYYPRYYKEVLEMDAILRAQGRFLDVLDDDINQIYSDQFIDSMDEETIRALEIFLGISLNKERTLEDRRMLIKAFFIGSGKISASTLEQIIKSYTGADVTITFEPYDEEGNNCLYIEFERGNADEVFLDDILYLLDKLIPAHIIYDIREYTHIVYGDLYAGIGMTQAIYPEPVIMRG